MRTTWERFRSDFVRRLRSPQAQRQFERLRRRDAGLAAFSEAGAVVARLNRRDADHDAKDALIRGLILAIQARGPEAAVASDILFVAFWPALQQARKRLRTSFEGLEHELAGDVTAQFIIDLHDLNLSNVRRVAGTIARSLERNLKRAAVLRRRVRRAEDPIEEHGACPPALVVLPKCGRAAAAESSLGVPPWLDEADETEALRRWLAGHLGEDDADLVTEVEVLGRSARSVAEERGLQPATLRKRLERARRRIRVLVTNHASVSSHRGSPDGVALHGSPHLRLVEMRHARSGRR